MIINSHVHVNTSGNFFYYPEYDLQQFLTEMQENRISIAFPSLNPKVDIFRCPNAETQHLSSEKTICTATHKRAKPQHRVAVFSSDNQLVLQCKTCGKVIAKTSIDPLRVHNKELIMLTKPYRSALKPLLYLLLSKATMQQEIDFWENNYPNSFVGFKLHPWNDQVSVADFRLHASKPFLIHTGIRELESAKNAIAFAKNNPNLKVVLAHAAALDENALQEISLLDNVWIDCCPSTFMYENRFSAFAFPQDITSPADIYYKALDYLPSSKVLFGTDSPWGNSRQELAVIQQLQVPESVKAQILYRNACEVYGL